MKPLFHVVTTIFGASFLLRGCIWEAQGRPDRLASPAWWDNILLSVVGVSALLWLVCVLIIGLKEILNEN